MRSRSLVVLAVVTVVVIAAAGYALKRQNALENAPPPGPTPLFPTLLQHVNDVAQITVATAKDHLTIRRTTPGHWVVVEKDGYPASIDKVKKAVVGLAETQRIEPRTADPKLYKDIGVSALDAPGSQAVQITLTDEKGKPLAALLVGNTKSFSTGIKPGTFYVREPTAKRSWLARGRLGNIKPDLLMWIASTILNIPQDRIKEVEIAAPDAKPILIRRKSPLATDIEVSGLPAAAKPDLAVANQVPTALQYLSIEDVAKPQGWGFAKAPVTTFRTFDGLVVKARTVKHDGKDWVKFAVSYAGPAPAAAPAAKPEGKAKAATVAKTAPVAASPLKTPAEAQTEAKGLASALDGWAFEVAGYHAAFFTETAADLTARPGKKAKPRS